MRRAHAAVLALSVATAGASGFAGWRMMKGRGNAASPATSTATPNSTPTSTAEHHPAAREAVLLRAADASAITTTSGPPHPHGSLAGRDPSPPRGERGSSSTSSTLGEGAATATADHHPPGSPAAREAAMLRALEQPAPAGPPPTPSPVAPLSIRPQIAPRFSAETRTAADAAAEVRAAYDLRGRAVPTWPPLVESNPPPGPRLNHAQRPARKVARARPAPAVVVPERLDQWGE